jgi:hypothetical protein
MTTRQGYRQETPRDHYLPGPYASRVPGRVSLSQVAQELGTQPFLTVGRIVPYRVPIRVTFPAKSDLTDVTVSPEVPKSTLLFPQ